MKDWKTNIESVKTHYHFRAATDEQVTFFRCPDLFSSVRPSFLPGAFTECLLVGPHLLGTLGG